MATLQDRWFADCEADCKTIARIAFVPHRDTWLICTWNEPPQAPKRAPWWMLPIHAICFTAWMLLAAVAGVLFVAWTICWLAFEAVRGIVRYFAC